MQKAMKYFGVGNFILLGCVRAQALTSNSSSSSTGSSSTTLGSSTSPTTSLSTPLSITSSASLAISGNAVQTSAPGASVCCFVVQDTVSELWWMEYALAYTTWVMTPVTYITTLVTPYPTTTITNLETNVYTTNASFAISSMVETQPANFYYNPTPAITPFQSTTRLNNNISSTVIGGTTVSNGQAIWEYNTIKVITVAAVTDDAGNVACGTTSSLPWYSGYSYISYVVTSTPIGTPTVSTFTITTVEPLYSTVAPGLLIQTGNTTVTSVSLSTGTTPMSAIYLSTLTYDTDRFDSPTFTGINSNAQAYFGENFKTSVSFVPTMTAVEISLSTPWVYYPVPHTRYGQGPGLENYGYPPQDLLDHLVGVPEYSAQFPGLANCMPGGPSILRMTVASTSSPVVITPAAALFLSTIITVTPTDVVQTSAGTALPASTSGIAATQTAATPSVFSSSTTTSASKALSADTSAGVVVQPSSSTASGNPPAQSAGNTIVQHSSNTALGVSTSSTPGTTEDPNAPDAPSSTTKIPSGTTSLPFTLLTTLISQVPSVSIASVQTTNTQAASIASQIASIIGASQLSATPTVISGTSEFIISATSTVPLNPSLTLSGLTTIISGTTKVIMTTARTVPVSEIIQNLPGSTTQISGGLNVIISKSTLVPVNSNLPALSGSTTVISSSTYVMVTGKTTIPVVMGPTNTSVGLAQITASGSGMLYVRWEFLVGVLGLVGVWLW